MNRTSVAEQAKTSSLVPSSQDILQRKCACGNHTPAGNQCSECSKESGASLQRLAVINQRMKGVLPIVPRVQQSDSDGIRVGRRNEKRYLCPASARAATMRCFPMKTGVKQGVPDASELNQGSNTKLSSQRSVTIVEYHRHRLSATIHRAEKADSSNAANTKQVPPRRSATNPRFSISDDDSVLSAEGTLLLAGGSLSAKSTVSPLAQAIREPQEGETVRLPDIVNVAPDTLAFEDAVASTFTFNPSITQSGATPTGFGITRPFTHAMSGISVTPARGVYNVQATVDNPITFQVRASTGRRGQLDVGSDSDSDITNSNYPTVVSDLTPCSFPSTRAACNNMLGRKIDDKPPRDNFWARDLTVRHERFHVDESVVLGRSGTALVQNWLNTQTAASIADVNALVNQVPARVEARLRAGMTMPAREERAYADGAELYRARANAIKTKGDAGGYAAAN